MRPNLEQFNIAVEKAAKLSANSCIRVTADHRSYWLFNQEGSIYIGTNTIFDKGEEPLPTFFTKRVPIYQRFDREGKEIGQVQVFNKAFAKFINY